MKMRLKLLFFALLIPYAMQVQAQFTGDVQTNANFFITDTTINACCNELYDNYKKGGESWFTLNYLNNDLDLSAGVRMDFFLNSQLHNPGVAYTGVGVGMFYLQKRFGKLDAQAGHIYEQFGSGLTFRSYEERTLGIDNGLLGLRLSYDLADSWKATVLGGMMKDRFGRFQQPQFGAELEGYYQLGEKVSMTTGASVMNRTIDQETMNVVVDAVNAQPLEERFDPTYNTYAASLWNQLDVGSWSWYIEGAWKSDDNLRIPLGADDPLGRTGKLVRTDGTVIYSSLSFSIKGFGVTGQYRRAENFVFRTDPFAIGLNGAVNYLPTLTRQNSWRLTARYNAVPQNLGENNYQLDFIFKPAKGYTVQVNFSDVRDLDNEELYREVYSELEIRTNKKWKWILGAQFQQYDQEFYEEKPNAVVVESLTPFTEFIYKFDRKKSLRTEVQYLHTFDDHADFGSWAWLLLEFNIAPNWSFSAADMWNVRPAKDPDPSTEVLEKLHYPNVNVFYTQRATRLGLTYTKQVEGIVCTGGICRYEPAFSGVKLSVASSF